MYNTLEAFMNYCDEMIIATETIGTYETELKFKTSKNVIEYILKVYKPDPKQRHGGYRDTSIDVNNYDPRRYWIDDIGRFNLTSKDLMTIISKSNSGREKLIISCVSSWITDDPRDEAYNKYNKKCLEKLKNMKLIHIADDCGGSEIDYDLESKKFYLFDHDYGFITVGFGMKSFMSLCSQYKVSKSNESFIEMMIATESDTSTDTCNVSFFGKTYKCTVYYENMKKEDIPAAKERLKTFLKEKPWNNKKVFDELFKTNSRLIKSVNEDPYFDGKKVNNGNDLLKSISRIDTIQVSKRHIVMSGEYWLDDEHGFSIDFPNGKFITKGDQEDKPGDEVNFTRLSSHMDLREYDR